MNKKGFTLVELMVVIVIIGVLAAVAIPRMMAAADRARAAEGPQTLGSISRMQHAYRVGETEFLNAPVTSSAAARPGTFAGDEIWQRLGFDRAPWSSFFTFQVTGATATAFLATATATTRLANVGGATLTLNQDDGRAASTPAMRDLVGSAWAAPTPPPASDD